MRGTWLLRVFSNFNPQGRPRSWRVGEPFEAHAQRFLPRIRRPLPGSAALMAALQIAKSDLEFRLASPQAAVDFAPGTTWVLFSDQVPHAVMAGQHMLEQTFHLEVDQLKRRDSEPLRRAERLLQRPLA